MNGSRRSAGHLLGLVIAVASQAEQCSALHMQDSGWKLFPVKK